MAISEALRLVVSADVGGAVSGIEKLGTTAEREISKSEKALDRWGNRMKSGGAHAIAFGSVALAGLAMAGDAASDLNEVASKSSTVFGDASKRVDEFATNADKIGLSKRAALEAASGFGNLFDQLGFASDASADMSVELTRLASDFASFHNADITAVIEAQTAAFRGEYDSLQQFVPTINAAAVQQQAMAETGKANAAALTDAEKAAATYTLMIEGAGAAQGDFGRTSDSAANQQRVLAARFENLKASIGQGVLPAMTSLLNVGNSVIGGFQDLNAVTDGTLGKIATFGAIGITAAGGLSMIIGQAMQMADNLGTAASAVSNLTGKLGGIKTVAAGAAGVAGIGALIVGVQQLRDARNAEALDEMAEGLEAIDYAATEASKKAIRNAEAFGFLDEMFEKAEDSGGDASRRLVDLMEKSDVSAGKVEHYRKEIEQHEEASKNAASSQEELAGAVGAGGDAMAESAEATEEATSRLQEYSDLLQGMIDPIFGAMDAITGVRDAQLAYRDAQAEVLTAQAELDKAIRDHGENSAEAAEATRKLEDAQRGVTDAHWATQEAAASADSALAALQDAVDRGDVSMSDFQDTLRLWVRQGFLTEEQARQAAIRVGALASEAEEADRKRVDIPVTANTRTAHERFAAVEHGLRALDGDSATVHVNVVLHDPSGVKMAALAGRRARGGPVSSGRLYEVAEGDKAELLEMAGHTYLIPGADGTVKPSTAAGTIPTRPNFGVPGTAFGGGGTSVAGRLDVTINDQRTTVALDGNVIAEVLNQHQAQNYGRASVRVR